MGNNTPEGRYQRAIAELVIAADDLCKEPTTVLADTARALGVEDLSSIDLSTFEEEE